MGVPSVFLRTFGCNFKCRGFGRSKNDIPDGEEYNPEVAEVIRNLSEYKSYEDLPLVTTGCDSYAAVYPEFKNLSPMMTTDQLAEKIIDSLPNREWGDEHLVITGGEPLLGWQRAYPDLLNHELMKPLKELTFETNGTQDLSIPFKEYLQKNWTDSRRDCLTFSVSAKLSVSGEKREEAINPEIVTMYEQFGYTYLKFVIANKDDAEEAVWAVNEYRRAGFKGPVYLMPVGGIERVYQLNNKEVALLALSKGYRYSDRLQVPLFKNEWGT